jgi:cytidine deaminase
MKEIKLESQMRVYEDVSELKPEDQELLQLARNTLDQAYAPYSGFKVAAVVRLTSGELVSGTNIENAAYPLCLCAERSALAAAESQYPGPLIDAMAITVRSEKKEIAKPATPCGSCRQVISEQEQRQQAPIRIILQGSSGPVYEFNSIAPLLPLSFNKDFL